MRPARRYRRRERRKRRFVLKEWSGATDEVVAAWIISWVENGMWGQSEGAGLDFSDDGAIGQQFNKS